MIQPQRPQRTRLRHIPALYSLRPQWLLFQSYLFRFSSGIPNGNFEPLHSMGLFGNTQLFLIWGASRAASAPTPGSSRLRSMPDVSRRFWSGRRLDSTSTVRLRVVQPGRSSCCPNSRVGPSITPTISGTLLQKIF